MSTLSVDASPLLLVALVIIALQLARVVTAYLQGRVPAEEQSLELEQRRLRGEIAKLSTVADFVAKSLLERKLVKADKEHARIVAARGAQAASAASPSTILSRYVQPGALAILAIVLWGSTLVRVPPRLLWPLAHADGSVGPLLWGAAVLNVASRVVPRLAAAAGFAPAAPPQGLLARVQSLIGL